MPHNQYRIKQRPVAEMNIPVSQAVQDFLASAEVKRLRPKTVAEYTYALNTFAQWCQEHSMNKARESGAWSVVKARDKHDPIVLKRVDNQVVFCFLEHIRMTHKPSKSTNTTLSDHTFALYVKDIKRFLNWCLLDEQYSQHVLASQVARIQMPKIEEKILETFSREQLLALKIACKQEISEHLQVRDLAIICTLLDTGIRAQELLTLTIGHTYLQAKNPRAQHAPDAHLRVYGKGGKYREVGLGEETRRAIQKYISEFRQPTIEYSIREQLAKLPNRAQEQLKRESMHEALLFVNRTGEQLTKSGLDIVVRRLGQWAEIEGVRCSPHTFRHTFSVNFMQQNENDIYALSRLLGHTSVKVTENYLRSYRQSEARKGTKSVNDSL